MDKEEKKKQILLLEKEQYKYIKKAADVAKLPPGKRLSTGIKRVAKIIGYAMKVKQLDIQKQIIASQPIFNHD
jgi:hypothetical protein